MTAPRTTEAPNAPNAPNAYTGAAGWTFTSPYVVLARDNIDTDQIIPAGYLKFSTTDPEERKFFGMYALSSVPEGQRGLPAHALAPGSEDVEQKHTAEGASDSPDSQRMHPDAAVQNQSSTDNAQVVDAGCERLEEKDLSHHQLRTKDTACKEEELRRQKDAGQADA